MILKETEYFSKWLSKLKDIKGKVSILRRLKRIQDGNLGDYKYLSDGISEFRFSASPGYRIYFTKKGSEIILLLVGGDKSSQSKDIQKAKDLAKEFLDE